MNFGFKREVSCFLVPMHGVWSITSNDSAGAVEFDFFTIWQKLKEVDTPYVSMIHTHPPGHTHMSPTDWNMVYGWVQAIGKPILFLIVTEDTRTYYLCKRDAENKSLVHRDIVEVETNDVFKEITDSLWFLSNLDYDKGELGFMMDEVTKIINEERSKANFLILEEETEEIINRS